MQVWPTLSHLPKAKRVAANSRSASAAMMQGLLPPSSRLTGVRKRLAFSITSLPTPGLPTSSTFSALSTNLSVASSSTRGLGTEGWKDQSKSASVFTHGNPDERIRSLVILCVLASTSTCVICATAEQKSASPSDTIRM